MISRKFDMLLTANLTPGNKKSPELRFYVFPVFRKICWHDFCNNLLLLISEHIIMYYSMHPGHIRVQLVVLSSLQSSNTKTRWYFFLSLDVLCVVLFLVQRPLLGVLYFISFLYNCP